MNPISDAPSNREMAAVARRAADIIQEHGKATGVGRDDQGRVCAIGALTLATVTQNEFEEIFHRVEAFVSGDIPMWSDLPTTTAAVIAKTFLQVADQIEVAS